MFICCPQVRGGIYLAYWEDLLPGHGGALEEQGPEVERHVRPSLKDTQPELPGDSPWCTVLAGLHKHIYWGCDDAAHCPPQTLCSWDCQERIEVLCRGGRLSSTQSRWRRASQPRRRSRSSSRCHFQTPAWGNRDGHSHGSSPCMPLRSHCRATAPTCTPSRCYCRATASPNTNTMPKLALAVNVPSHAQSSYSGGGMAWASLNNDDAWDDDFQTPHTPVHCHGRMESLRGSPGW